MKLSWMSPVVVAVGLVAGCASYPMPAQRMADAEAATRTATDLGAGASPQGQLHLRLAQEEITQAKQLIANGDNERADFVLMRARSDAELAVAEAKDINAQADAQKAAQKINELRNGPNAPPAGMTTTTSATVAPSPGTQPTTTTTTSTTSTGAPK